jgi:hypothetical protein
MREKSKFDRALFPLHLLEREEGDLQFLGLESKGGRSLAHVRVSGSSSIPEDYYFDSSSGLLWMRQERDEKGSVHSSEYLDYRKVGELLIPFTQLNRGPLPGSPGEGCIEQIITDIRLDEPLNDAIFKMPAISPVTDRHVSKDTPVLDKKKAL